VRKAQVKLATYYLSCGDVGRARRIFDDMKLESRERLRTIHFELAELAQPEWWEITNREVNWDYLSEPQKQHLPVFFDWFFDEDLAEAPQEAGFIEQPCPEAIQGSARFEPRPARHAMFDSPRTGSGPR
jgi:hypothetical protein